MRQALISFKFFHPRDAAANRGANFAGNLELGPWEPLLTRISLAFGRNFSTLRLTYVTYLLVLFKVPPANFPPSQCPSDSDSLLFVKWLLAGIQLDATLK